LLKGLKVRPELFLSAAMFAVAAVQLFTTISNNKGTTQQTDQIIGAANVSAYAATQNLQASRNFADSARSINQGVSNAVDKLNLQAVGTEDLVEQAAVQASAAIKAARAAERAATTARDAMYLNERAWAEMDVSIAGPLIIRTKTGAYLPIKMQITNVGHSPAQYVKKWAMLIVNYSPSTEEIPKFCPITQPARANETDGIMLFPGRSDNGEPIPGTSPLAARASPGEINRKSGGVNLTLIACIDYTLPFDSVKHHQTAQTFQVSWLNDNQRWSTTFPHDQLVNVTNQDKVRIIPDLGSIAN
jgi:hypothetical protein